MTEQAAMPLHATGQTAGPEVMVSYSSQDRPRVLEIVQRLRSAGVAVWIDFGGIDGAQRWSEEIVNAIDACKTVLLVISRTSVQSENIAKEVALAWESGKNFLPLYLEEAKIPKSMQYPLAGIQHIKLFEGDSDAKFISILRSLTRLNIRMSAYSCALVSADSGDKERALEWLNTACEQRNGALARLQTEPAFRSLRSDPRFSVLARRAESLQLEPEGVVPESPVRVQPGAVAAVPTGGPVPAWKKVLWPDIVDDRSARHAAAQGVWACAFIVAATFLASMLTSSNSANPGAAATGPGLGLGWNDPMIVAIIFAPIAFGIQKMGRAAAIIGLVLCSLGAMGNLNRVHNLSSTLDNYARVAQYPQYQAIIDFYSSQYHYAWLSVLISLACVAAFTNSTRGTLAYRQLVQSQRAADKQDAINRSEWASIKAKFVLAFEKVRGGAAAVRSRQRTAMAAKAPVSLPDEPVVVVREQPPASRVPASPVQLLPSPVQVAAVAPPATPVTPPVRLPAPVPITMPAAAPVSSFSSKVVEMPAVQLAPPAAVLARRGFSAVIGVEGSSFAWFRVAVFFAANLLAYWTYLLWVAISSPLAVPAAYWLFAIFGSGILTIAALAAFRLVRNVWVAALVGAAITTAGALLFYPVLPSFAMLDLLYREQFQEFVVLPFLYTFILLAALAWLIPRLQPLALSLWLGAMAAEVVTTLVANALQTLGSHVLPDAVLASTSVFSAILRSLMFALLISGALHYAARQSGTETD